ncbi:MAG: universal stress protein [Verrucomicrobia bacterium]|nr:universal stress protein [Verrucomicrobiota bacterium]
MYQKILVGYDGSAGGQAALQRALVIAKCFNAQITALWVREPLPRHSDLPGEYEEEKEAADEYFTARCQEVANLAAPHALAVACETRRGHPAKEIVNLAREGGYDLIVVGHSDHSELWGRLLGDTADRISDHAHCSVLIVKTGATTKGASAFPWGQNPKSSV